LQQIQRFNGLLRVYCDGIGSFQWSAAPNSGAGSTIGGRLSDREQLSEFMKDLSVVQYKIPTVTGDDLFLDLSDTDIRILEKWSL